MKKSWTVLSVVVVLLGLLGFAYAKFEKSRTYNPYDLKDGDIVFQETNSSQGKAVKAATDSRWTHVGMVYFHDGKAMVIEAVQPVKVTPLSRFIARSPKSFYAMRLKNRDEHLTENVISEARAYSRKQLGKNYDSRFQWSDDRIYCSELVWKIYQQAAGIELCKPRPFRSYNLTDPTVQKMVKQRYGSMKRLPLGELAVAPSDLAQSELLEEAPRKNVAE